MPSQYAPGNYPGVTRVSIARGRLVYGVSSRRTWLYQVCGVSTQRSTVYLEVKDLFEEE